MFLCLSSGSTPRYREDILRAISMPAGTILQFRYQARYVAPDILSKPFPSASQVLIAYIDQSDTTKPIEIVPCRFAVITTVTAVGTALTLLLELKDFAFSENLAQFNSGLRASSGGILPAWQAGKPQGHYWLNTEVEPNTILSSNSLEYWEKLVKQLADRTDFQHESCFYTVVGVYEIASKAQMQVRADRYEVKPSREYELRLYHFYPKDLPLKTVVSLATSSQWLSFTTNPVMHMDSRYDLKRVRFKTGKPSNAETGIVSIVRNAGQDQSPNLDFDLSILVRGTLWRTLVYGVILGILLAGTQIVATLSNPTVPASNVAWICALSALIGIATGVFAAFGLKTIP